MEGVIVSSQIVLSSSSELPRLLQLSFLFECRS